MRITVKDLIEASGAALDPPMAFCSLVLQVQTFHRVLNGPCTTEDQKFVVQLLARQLARFASARRLQDEVIPKVSEVFSSVRLEPIESTKGDWHANAHDALRSLSGDFSLDLGPRVFPDPDPRYVRRQAVKPPDSRAITAHISADLSVFAHLIDAPYQRIRALVNRLVSASSIEFARAKMSLFKDMSPTPIGQNKKQQALSLLLENPELSNAALAARVGVDRATVGRWPEIRHFRAMLEGNRLNRPRGGRRGGDLEACEDGEAWRGLMSKKELEKYDTERASGEDPA